jgi:carbon starvation protein
LDAGTRVGRYLVQDLLGNVSKRLGDIRFLPANFLASGLIVAGWGAFLIQGVRDPEGGIKALWPLFGIANQMLAAIALCLATTVILKMHLHPAGSGRASRPALALVTALPLAWLLAVTMTAGIQKVFHSDPRIGFLAQARVCDQRIDEARAVLQSNPADAERAAAEQTLHTNIRVRFNQRVDAVAASLYLITLTLFVLLSTREWILLLARRRLAELHETPPVWLPDYAVVEARPFRWFNLLALALALARELGGEAAFDREKQLACACPQRSISDPEGADATAFASGHTHGRISAARPDEDGPRYAAWLEQRYRSPRKCC